MCSAADGSRSLAAVLADTDKTSLGVDLVIWELEGSRWCRGNAERARIPGGLARVFSFVFERGGGGNRAGRRRLGHCGAVARAAAGEEQLSPPDVSLRQPAENI